MPLSARNALIVAMFVLIPAYGLIAQEQGGGATAEQQRPVSRVDGETFPSDAKAESHPGQEEEQPGLLSVDLGTAIWTIVLFAIILVILGKFVWPPILKGLQDRENKIRGDLTHAEQAAKQAAATLEEYRRQLAEANAEARKIIEQGRADAQKLAASLQAQTQAEIDGARKRAQVEIASARQQAIADLYTHAATLATEVASKILKREIRPEDQRQLIEDSLAAIKSGDSNN